MYLLAAWQLSHILYFTHILDVQQHDNYPMCYISHTNSCCSIAWQLFHMLYFTHKFLLFNIITIITCVIFHTHSCCSLSHGGVPHRFILFDFGTTLHCPMNGISHKSLLFDVMTMKFCWIISCGSRCVFLFGCKEPVIPVIKVLIPSHNVHQLPTFNQNAQKAIMKNNNNKTKKWKINKWV